MYIENQDVNTLGTRGINARGDGTSGLLRLCRKRLSSVDDAGKFLGFTPRIPAVFSRRVVQSLIGLENWGLVVLICAASKTEGV